MARSQDERQNIAADIISAGIDTIQAGRALLNSEYAPCKRNIREARRKLDDALNTLSI